MSESVHAVVSNKHSHSMVNSAPAGTGSTPVDEDDDDIDIIGRSVDTNETTLNHQHHHHQNHYRQPPSGQHLNRQPDRERTDSSASTADATAPAATNEWSVQNPTLVYVRNRLRKRLRYHFMSPIDKWRIKGQFPWKLLIQMFKIFIVTAQVVAFGRNFTSVQSVDITMQRNLHQYFLLSWDPGRDFVSVPPTHSAYAVYSSAEVYDHLDYAIRRFANVSNFSFGTFGYQLDRTKQTKTEEESRMSPVTICLERYANVTMDPSYGQFYVELDLQERCITMDNLYPPNSPEWLQFSTNSFLRERHLAPDFQSLVRLTVKFPLRAMILDTWSAGSGFPQCFDLNLALHMDNRPHIGQLGISMEMHRIDIPCYGKFSHQQQQRTGLLLITLNMAVMFLCLLSMFLCTRTLWRAMALRRTTSQFFLTAYKRPLDGQSSLHFIDGWILMILLNDFMLIIGSGINLLRHFNIGPQRMNLVHPAQLDSLCSAFLGLGLLLVWFGILRYLAFFDQYNVLLVTLKHASTRVFRFLLCVLILYGGFCFSGWIILGPYHYKFTTLAGSSECLFALMNGDDVFATFAYLQTATPFVWWFSRIYLYSYVLLFIYVVLSLFIAILMDSYETIKQYYSAVEDPQRSKIKIDFTWCNDQLSRFLQATFEHDENNTSAVEDTLSSYRLDLLDDETTNHHQCCPCHRRGSFRWIGDAAGWLWRAVRPAGRHSERPGQDENDPLHRENGDGSRSSGAGIINVHHEDFNRVTTNQAMPK